MAAIAAAIQRPWETRGTMFVLRAYAATTLMYMPSSTYS